MHFRTTDSELKKILQHYDNYHKEVTKQENAEDSGLSRSLKSLKIEEIEYFNGTDKYKHNLLHLAVERKRTTFFSELRHRNIKPQVTMVIHPTAAQ